MFAHHEFAIYLPQVIFIQADITDQPLLSQYQLGAFHLHSSRWIFSQNIPFVLYPSLSLDIHLHLYLLCSMATVYIRKTFPNT